MTEGFNIVGALMMLVPMVLSLTIHEYAHALAAKVLGDSTAEHQGRLTLNPIAHIDLVGTIGLPLLLLMSGTGFFFGWAKPVPVNPALFRRSVPMRTGMMITAAAGPLSNVLLAIVFQAVLATLYFGDGLQNGALTEFVVRMVTINVALAVFNMLPVHPLDGQKVLLGFLPADMAHRYEVFSMRYGSWLLMGVVFFGGRLVSAPLMMMLRGLAAVFGMPSLV